MLRSTRKGSAKNGGSALLPLNKNNNNNNTTNGHGTAVFRSGRPSRSASFQGKVPCQVTVTAIVAVIVCTFCLFAGRSGSGAVHRATLTTITMSSDEEAVSCYDIVVVGAGPAGLTAALFGARAGLTVLVMGSDAGQLSEAAALDNYPSYYYYGTTPRIAEQERNIFGGQAWLAVTKQQAAATGVHFALAGLLVSGVQRRLQKENALFALNVSLSSSSSSQSQSTLVHARAVIVAAGAESRKLHLPDEDLLWGKSIHSCAICDGSAYANKTVIAVGGGDAAVDAALLLSRHAARVIVLHRREDFRASNQRNVHAMLHEVPNIQVRTPYVVERYILVGNNTNSATATATTTNSNHHQLTAVHIRNTNTDEVEIVSCEGVFVLIGSKPNSDFLKGTVQLDAEGLVVLSGTTAAATATSLEGVFAAGEVTDNQYKQAITAAAAGAQAAIDAERWLRQNNNNKYAVVQAQLPNNIPLQTTATANNNKPNAVPTNQGRIDLALLSQQPVVANVVDRAIASAVEDCDLTREDCINKLVHKYPVVVFSKPWCPFCKKALEALAVEGVTGEPYLLLVNLADDHRTKSIQSTLAIMTGRRTVPNVFVGGTSIGGGDETVNLHRVGKLRVMLQEAKAITVEKASVDQCDLTLAECITAVVEKYPVVVFSKPWCPFCRKAIEALAIEGVLDEPYLHVIDLDALGEQGGAIQTTLQQMTGRRTVPNVFVFGKSIGGGDETTGLHRSGQLRPLLEQAKAYG